MFRYLTVSLLLVIAPLALQAATVTDLLKEIDAKVTSTQAKEVRITLPQTATVADVIISVKRNHTGFNMPTTPRFTHRTLKDIFLASFEPFRGHFSLKNGQVITSAAMERFVMYSNILFLGDGKVTPAGIAYEAAINAAIAAHKTWFANQTPENLHALNTAEDAVLEQLKTLPLTSGTIKGRLEKMLSTAAPSQALDALANAQKAAIDPNYKGDPSRFTYTPASFLATGLGKPLLTLIGAFVLFKALPMLKAKTNALVEEATEWKTIVQQKLASYAWLTPALAHVGKNLQTWLKTIKLTPEPDGGINVVIELEAAAS